MDKRITVEEIIRVSQMIHKSGIPTATSVLFGLPDERKEDMEATLKLMKLVKTDIYDISSYVPLPGSPLYNAMGAEEKRNIDWHKVGYKSFHNYFLKTMTHDELKGYLAEAYKIAGRVRNKTLVRFAIKGLLGPLTNRFRVRRDK
jgi:radical SAM superfamily enzyme YgiQ (UPF0313 family)